MNEENKDVEELEDQPDDNASFIRLYIAIACFAVGVVLFALSFIINGAGIYLLISGMIMELCCMSFLNAQKRIYENKVCIVFKYLSYAVLAASLIVFIIGTVINASNKN